MLVHTLGQGLISYQLHFRRQLLQWHALNDGWVPQIMLLTDERTFSWSCISWIVIQLVPVIHFRYNLDPRSDVCLPWHIMSCSHMLPRFSVQETVLVPRRNSDAVTMEALEAARPRGMRRFSETPANASADASGRTAELVGEIGRCVTILSLPHFPASIFLFFIVFFW